MAKGKNAPFGLRPVRRLDGCPWNGHLNHYKLRADYPNPIYYGDLVVLNPNTGYIELPTGDYNITFGVFQGCKYKNARGEYIVSKCWRPNSVSADSADITAIVCDDHNVVYEIQVSSTTATVEGIEQKDVGNNFEINGEFRDGKDNGGAPDPTPPDSKPKYGQKNPGPNVRLGISGLYLDKSSKVQTVAPARVIGLAPYPDNPYAKVSPVPTDLATDGAYNIAMITLNNQAYRTTSITDTTPAHVFLKVTVPDNIDRFSLSKIRNPERSMSAMPLPFDGVVDNSGWGTFPATKPPMNNVTFVIPSDGTYTITAGVNFGGPPYVRTQHGAFFLILNGTDGTPGKTSIAKDWATFTSEDMEKNPTRLLKPTYNNRANEPEVSLSSAKTLGASAAVSSPFDIVTSASTSYRFAKGDTFGVAFGCDRPSSDDPSLAEVIGTLRGNAAGTLTYVSIQKTGL